MNTTINYPYRFKLRPTSHQERWLRQVGGANRFIYNHYLADERIQSVKNWCQNLTQLKQQLTWLKDVPSQTLQQKIKDLHNAWDRFFKRLGNRPKFKSKKNHNDSFRFPQGFKLDNDRIFLPKLGWVRFWKSRDVDGELRSVTVKQETDGWYVVILTQQEIEINLQKPNPIGIDLGINTFATLSDGTKFESIKPLKKQLKKLAREQRRLARKQRGSKNRDKQRTEVARVYKKVTNVRNDYLHKVSTQIAKNHSLVGVEDLHVKGMVSNRKLARAISDQGWSRFLSMLEYKTYWYGSRLVKVDRWFASSKLCSQCGSKKTDLKLSDRTYHCEGCGLVLDRDLNAARNILSQATGGQPESQACGDHVRPKLSAVRQRSLKQEPIRSSSLTAASG